MKVKLVGAKSFSCPPKGMMSPVQLGQVIEVDKPTGEFLLSQTYRDALNNVHPVFSADEDAEVTYVAAAVEKPLDEAIKEIKEDNAKPRSKRSAVAQPKATRTRSKTKPATAEAAEAADAE